MIRVYAEPPGAYARVTAEPTGTRRALATFTADAYDGGPMRPRITGAGDSSAPTVIDIGSMRAYRNGRKMPILYGHDQREPIGHTTRVDLGPDRITAEGVLSVPGRYRDMVVGASRSGYQWAVSIGVSVVAMEYLPAGKTAVVNGRRFAGPLNIGRRGELTEISFLTIGANRTASARVVPTT